MRGFFGELLCECQSITLHEFALTTPESFIEVTELLVICVDCEAAFYELADTHVQPAPAPSTRPRITYSKRGTTAVQGVRMATAKKTTPKTTRGRNQDSALVASMEDYEVKYLAQKHSVTQKAVKAAVEKVGNSRTKVERELKAGKG